MSVPTGVALAVPIAYPVAWTHTIALTWKWVETARFRAVTDTRTWSSP